MDLSKEPNCNLNWLVEAKKKKKREGIGLGSWEGSESSPQNLRQDLRVRAGAPCPQAQAPSFILTVCLCLIHSLRPPFPKVSSVLWANDMQLPTDTASPLSILSSFTSQNLQLISRKDSDWSFLVSTTPWTNQHHCLGRTLGWARTTHRPISDPGRTIGVLSPPPPPKKAELILAGLVSSKSYDHLLQGQETYPEPSKPASGHSKRAQLRTDTVNLLLRL